MVKKRQLMPKLMSQRSDAINPVYPYIGLKDAACNVDFQGILNDVRGE